VPAAVDATTDLGHGFEEEQARAERTLLRAALIGVGLGSIVCVAIWIAIAVMALAGTGESVTPMIWVGVVCGLFAGVFFGGWAGVTVGCRALEETEHHQLPKAP
jgi:hypothetical protein